MYQIYKITNKLSANIKNFIEKKDFSQNDFYVLLKEAKNKQWNILAISILGKITFTYKESRSQKDDIPSPAGKLTKQKLRQYYFTQGT